jgi:hypothetical protein
MERPGESPGKPPEADEKPKRSAAQQEATKRAQQRGLEVIKAKKEEPPVPYAQPAEDGAPQVLQDMRHVYMNPKRHDRTEGQRFQREFREKQPAAFNSQLTEMEEKHRKEVQAKVKESVGEEVVDHGTDRAIALYERILAGEGE